MFGGTEGFINEVTVTNRDGWNEVNLTLWCFGAVSPAAVMSALTEPKNQPAVQWQLKRIINLEE